MASLCKCSPFCMFGPWISSTHGCLLGTLQYIVYTWILVCPVLLVVSMLHDLPFTVLTAEELQTFLTSLFARVHVEALIHGNVSKQVNSTVFSKVSTHLRLAPTPHFRWPMVRVYMRYTYKWFFHVRKLSPPFFGPWISNAHGHLLERLQYGLSSFQLAWNPFGDTLTLVSSTVLWQRCLELVAVVEDALRTNMGSQPLLPDELKELRHQHLRIPDGEFIYSYYDVITVLKSSPCKYSLDDIIHFPTHNSALISTPLLLMVAWTNDIVSEH